jgi:hypothetical protein
MHWRNTLSAVIAIGGQGEAWGLASDYKGASLGALEIL